MATVSASQSVKASTSIDNLAYYKAQYESLENELAEFQASSKELEAELEKDIEAAEKRERRLQEKVEGLSYEVEEWKTKHGKAKAESNSAQSSLEKEVTLLRETNRTLQARLRDIEVSNDNYERQARNTTSSLEDLEAKYNIAVERGVMAEEEIRIGDQEREALRIEIQRLREELADLNIEADIRQDKLNKAEQKIANSHQTRQLAKTVTDKESKAIPVDILSLDEKRRSESVRSTSDSSPATTVSSSTNHTGASAIPLQAQSVSSVSDGTPTQNPSTSQRIKRAEKPSLKDDEDEAVVENGSSSIQPIHRIAPESPEFESTISARSRQASQHDTRAPPKSVDSSSHANKHSNAYDLKNLTHRRVSSLQQKQAEAEASTPRRNVAQSGSLQHLQGLMSKMQLLEQRVHSVRSKLPTSTFTPPKTSRQSEIGQLSDSLGSSPIPSSVTVRSNKRRAMGSAAAHYTNSAVQSPLHRRSQPAGSTLDIDRGSSASLRYDSTSERSAVSEESSSQQPAPSKSMRTSSGHRPSSPDKAARIPRYSGHYSRGDRNSLALSMSKAGLRTSIIAPGSASARRQASVTFGAPPTSRSPSRQSIATSEGLSEYSKPPSRSAMSPNRSFTIPKLMQTSDASIAPTSSHPMNNSDAMANSAFAFRETHGLSHDESSTNHLGSTATSFESMISRRKSRNHDNTSQPHRPISRQMDLRHSSSKASPTN